MRSKRVFVTEGDYTVGDHGCESVIWMVIQL